MEERGRTPLGQLALYEALRLDVPRPFVRSYAAPEARRTEIGPGPVVTEWYPKSYLGDGTPIFHLRFALRYEPLDLRLLRAAFRSIDEEAIAGWVEREPTGAYSRRAWFLYETLTGRRLRNPDATMGNFVPALREELQFVGDRRISRRHRVIDNLLGDRGMYVTIRKTDHLMRRISEKHSQKARSIVDAYDPVTLLRAVHYLYAKETRASFAIEGEHASSKKAERFVSALQEASKFAITSEDALVELQGSIVDPRYAAKGWRTDQVFVGEVIGGYREKVHFICPKPADVKDLMERWSAFSQRLLKSRIDPVVAAAAISFAFVFIHPFDDGNGRIHRFLIHAVLAQMGFSPGETLFPVSASIVKSKEQYDAALETFSKDLFEHIEWALNENGELVVENETKHLYASFDGTSLAEYLYDRVVDTIENDLPDELGFLAVYDNALGAAKEALDMPDKRLSLLVLLCIQNGGRLSKRKRDQFPEIRDEEVRFVEDAVKAARQAEENAHPRGRLLS